MNYKEKHVNGKIEFGRKVLDHNRVALYRPSAKNAVTDKQLNYLRSLFAKKNLFFPFDSNREAKKKLSKQDASMMIDALKKGIRTLVGT